MWPLNRLAVPGSGHVVEDIGDLRAAGDGAGDADAQAAQDEQRGEGDDEGGQPRLHHDQAVEIADQHGDGEGAADAAPQRQAPDSARQGR